MKVYTNDNYNKTAEIKRTLKMTKMNLTPDDIDEMEGFFAQRVFQAQADVELNVIEGYHILKMVAIHLMNINRSANKQASCSKFKVNFKDTDRYVIINVRDIPDAMKTRDLLLEAFVSKPGEKGFFDGGDLVARFSIDPVFGIESAWHELESIHEFCETIQAYLELTETRESEELRRRLYNFIVTENTKFIAMKNIDPHYNTRTAEAVFFGVKVGLELTKYADEDQHTQLRLFSGALYVEDTIIGRLDSATIRKHVRTTLNKYIEDGGAING